MHIDKESEKKQIVTNKNIRKGAAARYAGTKKKSTFKKYLQI